MAGNLTLRNLPPGQSATVVKINGTGALRRRIMEMGIVPGSVINVVRYAPLGDPLEIKLKGCLLSLRKEEAELVEITKEN
ncbi:MAG: FeoA family protein [Peptococcaceae bacterium]|nr:ferrous iron transport protein A [Peptococcaceae bacterium]MDH7524550.1 FeoA family protein [Peptococcaceae bacterium]